MSAKPHTKKVFREDIRSARLLTDRLRRELATGNWEMIETLARDLEGFASMIACNATENYEQENQ